MNSFMQNFDTNNIESYKNIGYYLDIKQECNLDTIINRTRKVK